MKIFLVRGGSCAEDVTDAVLAMPGVGAAEMAEEELEGMLNGAADPVTGTAPLPGDRFAAAPDRVWVGWGFNAGASGDERFLQPVPPPGWRYDEKSGTLYRAGDFGEDAEPTAGSGECEIG